MLVLGSGGREHAIALALSASLQVALVYVSPGNSGTALLGCPAVDGRAMVVNVPSMPVTETVDFAAQQAVALVAVGPEQLLQDGVADALQAEVRRSCLSHMYSSFLPLL